MSDGKYHIVGEVGPVPVSVLKAKLCSLTGRIPTGQKIKYIMISPTPQYISEPCCNDSTHCTNSGDSGFLAEVAAGLLSAADLLKHFAGGKGLKFEVLYTILLSDDGNAFATYMEDCQTIWPPGDPVHLRAECYRATVEAILKTIVYEDDSVSDAEPKRQRLDSTVVRDKNSSAARQPSRRW